MKYSRGVHSLCISDLLHDCIALWIDYSFHPEMDYRADRFLKITIMDVNHTDKSKEIPFRKDILPQPNILMNVNGYI